MKLSETQAAARIGIKPKTLANWRSNGGGPLFYKIGSRILYDEADVDTWMAARKHVTTRQRADQAADRSAA